MRRIVSLATPIVLVAGPVLAASGPFFSLNNTNFVVLIAFVLFVGVLVYLKVPGMVGGLLDARAEAIKSELDEARSLREEAQLLLASYERKQKEVAAQSADIVTHAKSEAEAAAQQAHVALNESIARRLAAAVDQIASAEVAAVKEVQDRAVSVAIAAARDVIAASMSAKDGGALIDDAIADVAQKLH